MAHYSYNSDSDSQDCVSIILDRAGANTNNYPLKRITRDFNAVMDMYFAWAFEVDGRWPYDDVNETSPPIDKQNLVSGTNRYKFSDFTEKVINLIKLEALDSDGNEIELIPESFNKLSSFEELYIQADSGTPTHYCKYGDFIYLRPNPNYAKTDGLVAYFNRPATYMASDDTTDIPGVVFTHIPLVCELTAIRFKHDKEIISLNERAAIEARAEKIVKNHFARRNKDEKQVLKSRIKSFR